MPGVKSSPRLDRLKNLHQRIYNLIRVQGPTPNKYNKLNRIRRLITQQYKREHRRVWEEIIRKIDGEKGEDFWRSIRRIWGRKEVKEVGYLRDAQNREVHEEGEREEIFRKHWERVFRISEEENQDFDQETETIAQEIVALNHRITTPLSII